MPIAAAYPKELSDAYWKKVEKVIKVSNTGVGQTLRNVEKLYADFVAKVNAYEKAGTDAAGTKKAVTGVATALEASEKAFRDVYQKLKTKGKTFEKDNEMKVLDRYLKAVSGVSHDVAAIMSGRDVAREVGNYNDRLKMWAKFIAKP